MIDLTQSSIEGVVFDLDATLINLGQHVRWTEAQAAVFEAYKSCGLVDEELGRCNARGLFNAMGEAEAFLAAKNPEVVAEARTRGWAVLETYELDGVGRCVLMPGAPEALVWLRRHSIKMGVCTSNSTSAAVASIEKLGYTRYFVSVVGRTEGLRLKPYPDQVAKCLMEMRVEAGRSVMVGDSHNDVLAGKALGMRTVAVPVYFTKMDALEAAGPDAVIKTLDELPKTLDSFRAR